MFPAMLEAAAGAGIRPEAVGLFNALPARASSMRNMDEARSAGRICRFAEQEQIGQ